MTKKEVLEIRHQFAQATCSIDKICGCYVDGDGEFDGSFNTSFLKLSQAERREHLEIAKSIPFAEIQLVT